MILKHSLLYSLETVLDITFIIYQAILGNWILFAPGLVLLIVSTVVSYEVALRTHLHIYPGTSNNRSDPLFGRLRLLFMMNPWVQISWFYRHNRKNKGSRQYLYYRLSLTYFASRWIRTFPFVLLRLSHPSPVFSLAFMASVCPVILSVVAIVVASLDWEMCKRAKSHSRYDFLLIVPILGLPVNWQTVVRFSIYVSMITGRIMALFVLLFSIQWSDPELPYLIFLCHFLIFFFLFGAMWLRMDFVTFGNLLKTVVLSLNQTFFNQLDCFLKIPFNFHFIPTYIMNCVSIAIITSLHFLFSPEVDSRTTKFWAFSGMGIAALGLYILAGVLVIFYKKLWCPDLLKLKRPWKFDKISLNDV